jgi:Fe-S cluster biogenesis protein NfuA
VAHVQGTPARVVAVSSMGHQLQDMKLDDLVRSGACSSCDCSGVATDSGIALGLSSTLC